jgi:fatty acid desaturase
VPLVLLASHFMHGLLIGFHEASHGLLRSNRRINEIDGVLAGILSFMSFSLYRAAHQTHHAYLATERDEELWPFVFVDSPRWVRCLAAFLELNAGLLYTPALFLRIFFRKGSPIRNRRVRRRIWAEYVLVVVVWTAIFCAVAHWHVWTYFFWMYLGPAILAGNLQSWRKFIEHVGLSGNTVRGSTRSIVAGGWTGRLLSLSLLHEPYHGVHHLHVGLRHPELPRHAASLSPEEEGEMAPFPSYRSALLDLVRNLPDPRVGRHWERQSK